MAVSVMKMQRERVMHMKQNELASACGLPQSTLSQIETLRIVPSVAEATRIAAHLKWPHELEALFYDYELEWLPKYGPIGVQRGDVLVTRDQSRRIRHEREL